MLGVLRQGRGRQQDFCLIARGRWEISARFLWPFTMVAALCFGRNLLQIRCWLEPMSFLFTIFFLVHRITRKCSSNQLHTRSVQ